MESVITIRESSDSVRPEFPSSAPSASVSVRMVWAVVAGQRCMIECPAWCQIDHVAFPDGDFGDVVHHGDPTDLFLPSDDGGIFLFSSQLAVHPADGRPAHVFVDEMEGHRLDADQTEAFAARLEAQATVLRQQAAVLREAGQ